MTTSRLPINVIQTEDVEQFYEKTLDENQLGVSSLFLLRTIGEICFFKGTTKSCQWSSSRSTSVSWANY